MSKNKYIRRSGPGFRELPRSSDSPYGYRTLTKEILEKYFMEMFYKTTNPQIIKAMKSDKIKFIKSTRITIDEMLTRIAESERSEVPTPRSVLGFHPMLQASKRLQEARMWLGICLRELGQDTPYVNADNPSNDIVDPESDVAE